MKCWWSPLPSLTWDDVQVGLFRNAVYQKYFQFVAVVMRKLMFNLISLWRVICGFFCFLDEIEICDSDGKYRISDTYRVSYVGIVWDRYGICVDFIWGLGGLLA